MTNPTKDQQPKQSDKRVAAATAEGVALPMNLLKSLRRKPKKHSSEGGSSSSNVEGNNSDNSALVSLGNTSFGFNFDSEEGNSSPPNSERNGESDSEGNGNSDSKQASSSGGTGSGGQSSPSRTSSTAAPQHDQVTKKIAKKKKADANSEMKRMSHNRAADEAVANLHSLASALMEKAESYHKNNVDKKGDVQSKAAKPNRFDNESTGGYNTDDEGRSGGSQKTQPDQTTSLAIMRDGEPDNDNDEDMRDDGDENYDDDGNSSVAQSHNADGDFDEGRPKKKKRLNDKKREERNAREKERSFRISKQINELRALLSTGGVIVPKGTKSSVLTEAANYIRMLQQHQYRSEIDRHQLVQQIQMIGAGAHGPQAAQAIRHVAAQHGVWSLGNFGGVPPKSALSPYAPGTEQGTQEAPNALEAIQQTKIDDHEYRSVFNNCAVGMAIASMGGAFIDCNKLFCQLSNYSKQEVCSLTIFNLTARQDLQHAFDLISQLISPPMEAACAPPQPIVLRGSMKNNTDLGLGVALVKGDDGIAKFFCVTLIKNPASPFDDAKPIPATIELVQGTAMSRPATKEAVGAPMDAAPAFTTG